MVAISAGKSTNIHIKETWCLKNSKLQRCMDLFAGAELGNCYALVLHKQAAQLLKQLESSSSMLLVNLVGF